MLTEVDVSPSRLVSSDAMARGLDVPDIDHVVSYDVTAATTYVHRIGRTARAGQPGTALSLVTKPTVSYCRLLLHHHYPSLPYFNSHWSVLCNISTTLLFFHVKEGNVPLYAIESNDIVAIDLNT